MTDDIIICFFTFCFSLRKVRVKKVSKTSKKMKKYFQEVRLYPVSVVKSGVYVFV